MLLTGFSRIITNAGSPGEPQEIADGAIAVRHGSVAWLGRQTDVPNEFAEDPVERFTGMTALPGFVDSHTHAVFAGERSAEFAQRLTGATYEEILEAGGGIHSTVASTRAASEDRLLEESAARLDAMLQQGTTTVEVKSGYGLETDTEIRQLRVASAASERLQMDVIPTFLAHVVPVGAGRSAHVQAIVDEMLPAAAPHARFCDVFCDAGAFTSAEAAEILQAAGRLGLGLRIHAEQLTHSGGAQVAAMLGAASADHLDHVDEADIVALRDAGVVATLLPGVSFTMQQPPPPARALLDAGATVALATDCNPGTAYVTSMPFVITLAVLEAGMSIEEAVWAATAGGAKALQLEDRGRLAVGKRADVVVLDANSPVDLAYRPDADLVEAVFVTGGRVR